MIHVKIFLIVFNLDLDLISSFFSKSGGILVILSAVNELSNLLKYIVFAVRNSSEHAQ